MVYVSALWIGFDLLIAVRSQMTKTLTKKEFAVWAVAAFTVAAVSIYSDRQDAALMSSLKQGEDTIVSILSAKTNVPVTEGGEAVAKAAAAKIDALSREVDGLKEHVETPQIAPETEKAIEDALRAAGPHPVQITALAGDKNATDYGNEWAKILIAADWLKANQGPSAFMPVGHVPVGLSFKIKGPNIPDGLKTFGDILGHNNIAFDPHVIAEPNSREDYDSFVLVVGANP